MIKDIVVNLPLCGRDATTRFAASMAGYFNAQLTGVAFIYEPVIAGARVRTSFIDEQIAEAKKIADSAVDRFNFDVRREQISSSSCRVDASGSMVPSQFAEIARGFDVSIVGQVDPDQMGLDDQIAEATLFESGRPMIVVPYNGTHPFKLDRIAICWDGSCPATRAANDALPLLKRAHSVDLLSVYRENMQDGELNRSNIAKHLARHGVKVSLQHLPMMSNVSSTILNYVAETRTDMIVMGGYGHSRLREFILGGVTSSIFKAMTKPTLISH